MFMLTNAIRCEIVGHHVRFILEHNNQESDSILWSGPLEQFIANARDGGPPKSSLIALIDASTGDIVNEMERRNYLTHLTFSKQGETDK